MVLGKEIQSQQIVKPFFSFWKYFECVDGMWNNGVFLDERIRLIMLTGRNKLLFCFNEIIISWSEDDIKKNKKR